LNPPPEGTLPGRSPRSHTVAAAHPSPPALSATQVVEVGAAQARLAPRARATTTPAVAATTSPKRIHNRTQAPMPGQMQGSDP
jgi:hypothetical protein